MRPFQLSHLALLILWVFKGPRRADAMTSSKVELKILTLNCWGIPGILSNDLELRFDLIGTRFAKENHDVLLFQEVWREKDYQTLIKHLKRSYRFYHYYYSGLVGSGCCIFSKIKILDVYMHQYSLNGYFHKFFHGDFLGAKSANVALLEKNGIRVSLFLTHMHAEYDRDNDEYLSHRLAQVYELSQAIRWSSKMADCVVLGGDLNLEKFQLGYRLLQANSGLIDSWESCKKRHHELGNEDGNTCEIPSNSYVEAKTLKDNPKGVRIDYIMYRGGSSYDVSCEACRVLEGKGAAPDGRVVSLSDHEGVEATLVISKKQTDHEGPGNSVEDVKVDDHLRELLQVTLGKLKDGLKKISKDRVFCASVVVIVVVSLFILFHHSSSSPPKFLPYFSIFDVASPIGAVLHAAVLILGAAFVLHALILSTFEANAIWAHVQGIELRLRNSEDAGDT